MANNQCCVFAPKHNLVDPIDESWDIMGQLMSETEREDKPTICKFWKTYMKKGVDNMSASWNEATQTTMNGGRWKSQPECVHELGGFQNKLHIPKQIVGLMRDAGFDEVNHNGVEELLDSHKEDLTNDDVMHVEKQRAMDLQLYQQQRRRN